MKPLFIFWLLFCYCHSRQDRDLPRKPSARNLHFSKESNALFQRLISKSSVAISFSVKQTRLNEGTLFRAVSGKATIFGLVSRNPEKLLIFRYRSPVGPRIVKFPFDLAAEKHKNLSFSVQNGTLSLKIDCEELLSPGNTRLELPRTTHKTRLWVGQKNRHHSHFHGEINNFKISSTSAPCVLERLKRARKPAKDHHADFCPECFSYLKHRVDRLTEAMLEMRERLEAFESRVQTVQLHQRGCEEGSKYYTEGQRWDKEPCSECICVHGRISCHLKGCPKAECSRPQTEPGDCCPKCLRPCTFSGRLYEHGAVFSPKKCLECNCTDGKERCRFIKPHNCPALKCERNKQVSLPDKCCPVCKDINFCGATNPKPCGKDALCENGEYGPTCYCKPGYYGDPKHECFDVDECSLSPEIEEQIVGCGYGSVCVNTPGSFYCHCRPGFYKVSEKQCFDVLLH